MFATTALDGDLQQMASDLEDADLLVRISGGDLVAIEAKYHLECLVSYKNRHRSFLRKCSQDWMSEKKESKKLKATAFAELVSYIESTVESEKYIFKLCDLHTSFEKRLHELGVEKTKKQNKIKGRNT